MPFFGQDSRGPGNIWVRTNSGWRKVSEVGGQLNRQIKKFARDRIAKNAKLDDSGNSHEAPFTSRDIDCSSNQGGTSRNYLFTPSAWRSSKQRGLFVTVCDILGSFQLCTAMKDTRRFHFVCELLDIIISNHFDSLSGSAMQHLFSILEEAVEQVMETQLYVRRVVRLLTDIQSKMILNKERIIGSTVTYNCRLHLLNLWLTEMKEMTLHQREEDSFPALLDLPLVCLHRIFRCLSQPRDIIHLSQTCQQLHAIGNDTLLWERLFWYHFTDAQLAAVPAHDDGYLDWKTGFHNLRKVKLVREDYPILLELCCHCSCIYWMGQYHPCSSETPKEQEEPGQENRKVLVVTLTPHELIAVTIKL